MDVRDLRHLVDLRYFVVVFEKGSFSAAAAALLTVQSNVSTRIASLEQRFGVLLFHRRYRSVVPTDGAREIYPRAKALLAALQQAIDEVAPYARPGDPEGEPQAALRTSRGFTLLELLVVIVIIGLLAGFVAPRYFSNVGKSEVQVAKAQIDAFEKALDQYRLDTRHYPTTEQGLQALVERPANEPLWSGPYLRKAIPLDPWGNPYIYKQPGTTAEFELLSYGQDGQPGGTGQAADIRNF